MNRMWFASQRPIWFGEFYKINGGMRVSDKNKNLWTVTEINDAKNIVQAECIDQDSPTYPLISKVRMGMDDFWDAFHKVE